MTNASHHLFRFAACRRAASAVEFAMLLPLFLITLNGGLLNAVLGNMPGTSLSLSVMDYQALIDARIDLFDFLPALATRVNLTGVTYDELLNSNIKVSDIVAAMLSAQRAANGINAATTALSQISFALAGVATKIIPDQLIDLGPYASLAAGQKPQTGVSVGLYDLLSATGAIANGAHQIAAAVNLGLPGVAGVNVVATIGEHPQGSSWVTVGARGASVHTAQTRVLVSVQLLGSGSVSAVNLPVYVEVASGTATLDAVSCGFPNVNTSTVRLGVTPGIVDAWIGNVTTAEMTNFTNKPNPGPATLVNLGAVQVTGKAHAGMGNTTPTSVNFSYADITAQTKKTVTTTNFTQPLTGSLLGDLALTVKVGPLGLPIPGLGGAVSGIIGNATGSVDQVLASVLATLGIGLGQADVWVSGVRCDRAVLVN